MVRRVTRLESFRHPATPSQLPFSAGVLRQKQQAGLFPASYFTKSFSCFPGLNFTTRVAGILMGLPV